MGRTSQKRRHRPRVALPVRFRESNRQKARALGGGNGKPEEFYRNPDKSMHQRRTIHMTIRNCLRLGGTLGLVVILAALVAAPPSRAADLGTARRNFNAFCAKCHGPSGRGDGPAAAALDTRPRDFTNCARMRKLSDDTLFTAIKEGGVAAGVSHDMAAWGKGLKDDQIRDLVAYVRAFCKPDDEQRVSAGR